MKIGRTARRDIYAGRTIKVFVDRVALPNGREIELDFVEHPGASAIVPLHSDGTVTLERQWRYAAGGEWILEVPAGKLDTGETPDACARRELLEEVGLKAGKLEDLGFIYATPGFCDERIFLFLATELTQETSALEDDEIIETRRVPLAEAVRMCLSNEICDGKSVSALLRAAMKLGVSSA
jgi:ADP-ribose pyrophosphatase